MENKQYDPTLTVRIPPTYRKWIEERADRETGGNLSRVTRRLLALGLRAVEEQERRERVPA